MTVWTEDSRELWHSNPTKANYKNSSNEYNVAVKEKRGGKNPRRGQPALPRHDYLAHSEAVTVLGRRPRHAGKQDEVKLTKQPEKKKNGRKETASPSNHSTPSPIRKHPKELKPRDSYHQPCICSPDTHPEEDYASPQVPHHECGTTRLVVFRFLVRVIRWLHK